MTLLGLSESVERKRLDSFSSYRVEARFIQLIFNFISKLGADAHLVEQVHQCSLRV